MNVIPVVLGDVAAVLHRAPAVPSLDPIYRRVPDPLSPDDVLEVERAAVVHNPFGNLLARSGGNTSAVRAHHVGGFSTAVVGVTRAGAAANATDLTNATRPSCDDGFGTVYGDLLARADGGDGRSTVPAEADCGRRAALKGTGAGALVGHGRAGAVAGPATVAGGAVGTDGLGAALDVVRIGGAGSGDGNTTAGRAVSGGNTDTGSAS